MKFQTDTTLAAVYRQSRNEPWVDGVRSSLHAHRYRSEQRDSSLIVWSPDLLSSLPSGWIFTDGWKLGSLWLGRGRDAISISPKRIYFYPDGTLDWRPEREIVDLKKRPKQAFETRLSGLLELRGRLAKCACMASPVELESQEASLLDGFRLLSRKITYPHDTPLGTVQNRGGFFDVPDDLCVIVFGDLDVEEAEVNKFKEHLKIVFEQRGAHGRFLVGTLNKLDERLHALDCGCHPASRYHPVLFLIKHPDKGPSPKMVDVMAGLDKHQLPWRRAYRNDPYEWSISDQAGSILQAAGGLPHSVALDGGESLPWSIGIDLSHPREGPSTLCVSLVSPEGRLESAWLSQHRRDESIDQDTLRRSLAAIRTRLEQVVRPDGILIVRDGRLFEKENASLYLDTLGRPVTLVELRKNGNPPLLTGESKMPPTSATVAWVPNEGKDSTGFLVTLPRCQTGDFDRVLKITHRESWDEMGLGRQRVARILAAQCLYPGLGLKNRTLPAPIYWADGVAGANSTRLQFRGQRVVIMG